MNLAYLDVILKKITMKYSDQFYKVFNDKELSRLISIPYPLTKIWVKDYIERAMQMADKNERFTWAVLNRDDVFIGICLLKKIDHVNRSAELGYSMGRRYWRNGYTEMAARAVITYAIKELELNRIEIRVFCNNRESCSFVESLGGKLEGVLREATYNSGEFIDMNLYSILKKDYQKK